MQKTNLFPLPSRVVGEVGLVAGGKARQTYLSVWIDTHSRFLTEARYYVRENFDCVVDSLLRAWAKHGCSRELYADNGKIYHADGLTLACVSIPIRNGATFPVWLRAWNQGGRP